MREAFVFAVAALLLVVSEWLVGPAQGPVQLDGSVGKKDCAVLAWQFEQALVAVEQLYAAAPRCAGYREFAVLLETGLGEEIRVSQASGEAVKSP